MGHEMHAKWLTMDHKVAGMQTVAARKPNCQIARHLETCKLAVVLFTA